jgi:hypothetical protein
MESREYNHTELHRGRAEFKAWYSLVRCDFEIYRQTIEGLPADDPRRARLAAAMGKLAGAYLSVPAPWLRDHAYSDGAPATLPAAYQQLARRLDPRAAWPSDRRS